MRCLDRDPLSVARRNRRHVDRHNRHAAGSDILADILHPLNVPLLPCRDPPVSNLMECTCPSLDCDHRLDDPRDHLGTLCSRNPDLEGTHDHPCPAVPALYPCRPCRTATAVGLGLDRAVRQPPSSSAASWTLPLAFLTIPASSPRQILRGCRRDWLERKSGVSRVAA